ncbi:carboxypeptidase regulatory-like domain-containing protein [Candidatus Woesearchaeota archaeon]|nr:carboxypeptidase regulatory-like domain-containing protein [Candidatus Woesearchaeota archaeon]
MTKIRLVLVLLVLFFPIFLLFNVHAQDLACCIDIPNSNICVPTNLDGASCEGTVYPYLCENVPGNLCEYACKTCVEGQTKILVYGRVVEGCSGVDANGDSIPVLENAEVESFQLGVTQEECFEQDVPAAGTEILPTTVSGHVYYNGNGVIADVYCTGDSDKSGSDGSYSLSCRDGTPGVVTAYYGQLTGQSKIINFPSLTPVMNSALTDITIQEETESSVLVSVSDPEEKPVSGANIVFTVSGTSYSQTHTTESKGTWLFTDVPRGIGTATVYVTAADQGYADATRDGVLISKAYQEVLIQLRTGELVTIQGNVLKYSDNSPISGALVEILYASNSQRAAYDYTDANGFYSISVLKAGDYNIKASGSGFTSTIEHYVSTRDYSDHDILLRTEEETAELENAQFRLKAVKRGTSTGISGITFTVKRIIPTEGPSINSPPTNTNGEATIPGMNLGTYDIVAAHANEFYYPGYASCSLQDSSDECIVEMDEVPIITISGTVKDSSGKAVPNAQVKFDGKVYDTNDMGLFATGSFSFTDRLRATDRAISAYDLDGKYIREHDEVEGGEDGPFVFNFVLLETLCNSEGDSGEIVIDEPLNVDKNEITFSWLADCNADAFRIFRSEGSEDIDDAVLIEPYLEGKIKSFGDVVEPSTGAGKTYCYFVQGDYFGGKATPTIITSEPVCAKIADEECFFGDKEFCGDDGLRYKCINGEKIPEETQCALGETCMEEESFTGSSTTTCVEIRNCEMCNRPFGVFAYRTGTGSLFGGKAFPAPVFVFDRRYPEFESTEFYCDVDGVPCYKDVSSTVVEKNYPCSFATSLEGSEEYFLRAIDSCYDYMSEEACNANKCLKSEKCEWKDDSGAYKELGIGVCVPEEEKRTCSAFNQRSPVANDVFAAGSTARILCSLYAEDCYLSDTTGECLSKDEIACSDYNSIEDCIGEGDETAIIDVNVTWKLTSILPEKVFGDNKILQNSNDKFEIGICQYSSKDFGCIRNADNLSEDTNEYDGPDCPIGDRECLSDNIPPKTNIPIMITKGGPVILPYYVSDDRYSELDIETYFRKTTKGIVLYPVLPLTRSTALSLTEDESPYTITYFSKDPAENLEEVHVLNLVVDDTGPEITRRFVVDPNLDANTVSLTILLELPEYRDGGIGSLNDAAAYCINDEQTGLFMESTNEKLDDLYLSDTTMDGEFRDKWFSSYINIPTYNSETSTQGINVVYKYKCFDAAGNLAGGCAGNICQKRLRLDADGTISNPQPNDEAVPSRENVEISIETLLKGECRFSNQSNNQFSTWNLFSETGETATKTDNGYLHRSVVNVLSSGESSSEKHETFHVACLFEGLNGYVRGNLADYVEVTVDDEPPTTRIIDFTKGTEIYPDSSASGPSTSVWVNGPNLELVCEDYPMPYSPPESGCRNIYLCSGDDCNKESDDGSFIPAIPGSMILEFYSDDILGNKEQRKSVSIRFDGVPPELILASPFDSNFETNQKDVLLNINIDNLGQETALEPNGCTGGEGCEISPLSSDGVNYSVFVDSGIQHHNERLYDVPTSALRDTSITLNGAFVELVENKKNRVEIFTKDAAGNVGISVVTVIHDSVGPNLTEAVFKQSIAGELEQTNSPIVDSGDSMILYVENVKDEKPGTGKLSSRVDQVWAEDMFGAEYLMQRISQGSEYWRVIVPTQNWPVTSANFQTYLKISANDTLGNIAERRLDFTIRDIEPPEAEVVVENKYGDAIDTIVGGENFIIVSATEPLYNITLNMVASGNQGPGKFPVTFIARDYESITWVGTFAVPEGYEGMLHPEGEMYDLNGVKSLLPPFTFYTRPASLYVHSPAKEQPAPQGITPVNGVYIVDGIKDPYWSNLLLEREYQMSVNGKYYDVKDSGETNPINLPVLSLGENLVTIRSEDGDGNYEIIQQRVSVTGVEADAPKTDTTPPVLGGNPILSDDVQRINGTLVIKEQNLALISGTAGAETSSVYLIGQDGKKWPASSFNSETKTYTISNLKLVGNTYKETENNLQLVFEDAAENRITQTISIVKDRRPPHLVSLRFTRIN